MRETLEQLLAGQDLTEAQAEAVLRMCLDDEVSEAVKGGVLVALRAKGETPEEVRGLARAMRDAARPFSGARPGAWVDTCGTGGDGSHSINVSTATSLVLGAMGIPVVKHGNRSISSRSGSADVLEALGIALPSSPERAAALFDTTGWTFLFAPVFHPAMRAVVPVRRAMKIRTVFNLLGPLTNPARPPHQLLGAYSPQAAQMMAEALSGLEITSCTVVHGAPHWDEATPMGPFHRWDVTPGQVTYSLVDPELSYGIPRCAAEDLAGGSVEQNASALRAIFAGEHGPHRDAVLLNAALVLETMGRSSGRAAVAEAAAVLDDGRATAFVAQVGEASHE